jgi:hypothetical protein
MVAQSERNFQHAPVPSGIRANDVFGELMMVFEHNDTPSATPC